MEKKRKHKTFFFVVLVVVSFLTNFFWESLHGLLYKANPGMAAEDYVPKILLAAVMDTFGIIILYCLTAIVFRTWFWKLGLYNGLFFSLSSLAVAYIVESIALFELHLWQYRPSMPLVFGIGLSPLLQLSLTGLFSVFVAHKVADQT